VAVNGSNFVDYVKIHCAAGHGGAGSAHLHRSRLTAKGGPDGGDGGRGGNVYLRGNDQMWTLLHLKYKRHFKAGRGGNGSSNNSFGDDGEDQFVEVPLGTVAKDAETGEEIVVNTAKSNNLEAEVILKTPYPITYNDLKLTDQMKKTLFRVAGENNVKLARASTGAEDFSYFANKVPGFFFRLGGMPIEDHPNKGFSHHTPDFYIDDSGLILGVRAMANLAVDYLNTN